MSTGKPFNRKHWSRPLADLVGPCLTPALGKFGFGEADLLLFWPEIVGARLASRCEPIRLNWPQRTASRAAQDAATLVVRVEGAFAVELQHEIPVVIDRINTHFGWRCVGRVTLRQGPMAPAAPARRRLDPPAEPAVRRARDLTSGIEEADLRAALMRLGSRVLSP